jgi:hypothetical protein
MTAHAEWKYDGSTSDLDNYIDYSRIRTEGLYKSMWVLRDFKSPQTNASGKQFKSSVSKEVIDCQRSRMQSVALFHYSEQMGSGEMVFSGNYQVLETDWKYHPPNTMGDSLINTACRKK